jgi:GNAT superfamily N-acetyltransferase
MTLDEKPGHWQIAFNTQHLPRTLQSHYPVSELRLQLALPAEHLFLVAAARAGDEILGYLTMTNDQSRSVALIRDVLVSQPYRRHHIGTRLVSVARQWAKEHDLTQLIVEVSTQNFPALSFCQRIGFQLCGFNDHYFPNHDIAIFLAQSLR